MIHRMPRDRAEQLLAQVEVELSYAIESGQPEWERTQRVRRRRLQAIIGMYDREADEPTVVPAERERAA